MRNSRSCGISIGIENSGVEGIMWNTAGKNAKKIAEYIKHQLDEDKAGEQLTKGNF